MSNAASGWVVSSVAGGLALGIAWLFPVTTTGAVLGWLAVAALIYNLYTARPLLSNYLSGCIAIAIAFYWLPTTVQDFGGFSVIPAYTVHALFISGTAIQFIIFAWIANRLRLVSLMHSIAPAIAWIASEWLWIRIFPWEHAHSQIAFTYLIQIADIGGTALVTFLLFWLITAALTDSKKKKLSLSSGLAVTACLTALAYGHYKIQWYQKLDAPVQKIALLQANISTEEKHNIQLFKENSDRYKQLTFEIAEETTDSILAIWPESVIQQWIPDTIGFARRSELLNWLPDNIALLAGVLTYAPTTDPNNPDRFNSALAVFQNGTVPLPYHKRILMPFGEYMPFSETFPWIQDLNPLAAGFTPGSEQTIFSFPMQHNTEERIVRVAPLICYEDVLPALSREAVQKNAHLLVNLTNDAWFGKSHASRQHHQIAAFRAVENSRFLLRGTNTGLTSIVDPLGQTTAQLPVYSEGNIIADVLLLENDTLFSRYVGNLPRYLILFITLSILLFRRREKRKNV